MFVDSVNFFPKFRKQFVHIFILGLFDMIKDISEPSLRVLTFHLTCSKERIHHSCALISIFSLHLFTDTLFSLTHPALHFSLDDYKGRVRPLLSQCSILAVVRVLPMKMNASS